MHFTVRRAVRAALLLATATAALASTAAPASAGQLVYSYEPADGDSQIRAIGDDGSNDRMLVHEDDIPGAEAVYRPYVSPDGDTVVFQARTPKSWGLYCGFRCSGIYAYRNGTITRISQPPTDCPPGDLCMGLDTDPRITGGGNHLFYEMIYGEPRGMSVSSIATPYFRTMTPGGGDEVEVPKSSCGKGSYVTPNPALDGQFAASYSCSSGSGTPYALKVLSMGGGGEETLGYDDYEFANPAFRGDGQLVVGAEDGNDPGLWLYQRGGQGADRIAALQWDNRDRRPFNTKPTFVGKDRVAFVWDDTVRFVSTSCNSCTVDQTELFLEGATGIDGVAWTSRAIADPVRPVGGAGGGGGGGTPGTGAGQQQVTPPATTTRTGTTGPTAPATLNAPASTKLTTALRKGLTVPVVATKTGRLTVRATISGALAKKLRLVRKATKKPVVVAQGSTTVKKAGPARVTLKFTSAAKKRLKRAKSVPLTLQGTLAGGSVTGTTRLAR